MIRILFLESFHGGSHRQFAEGLCRHSRFEFDLFTLPMRFWKWRMRGAALHFARKVPDPGIYAAMVVTDLLSLADLKALWGSACPPAILYFHESQLTYPLPASESFDVQFGFTELSSALCASKVLFNSEFHRDLFFERVQALIQMMPDHRPRWVVQELLEKSAVLYPGVELGVEGIEPKKLSKGPPLVVWNHRWEFDKCPEVFFSVMKKLKQKGVEFSLVVLGQNFQAQPKVFLDSKKEFGDQILQFGFVQSRQEYLGWLATGDIVVSCAIQENFGISVVEAIFHGCFPVLPDRLAYPELLNTRLHKMCLYQDEIELESRLEGLLRFPEKISGLQTELVRQVERFSWIRLIQEYDEQIQKLIESEPSGEKLKGT
jgi:glycosyltransferase involved in cell wall biosynthesis